MWRKRGFDVRDAMEEMPQEIQAHIHGSGWLPQDELAAVLAAAEGLVFIPWFEGFGIPLIEAFSAGTPTIHSDRTSLPEVASGAGLEVDPGDADAVAAAMLRLEREPALGERLVELGRRRAEAFSWERTASLLWTCASPRPVRKPAWPWAPPSQRENEGGAVDVWGRRPPRGRGR